MVFFFSRLCNRLKTRKRGLKLKGATNGLISRTYDKGKEQEIERSKLFKALNATSNMKFKEYEDHGLKHI